MRLRAAALALITGATALAGAAMADQASPQPPAPPVPHAPPPLPPQPHQPPVTSPHWITRPDGGQFAAAYPPAAARLEISGLVVIVCTVLPDGRLTGCRTVSEDPADHGFDAAALSLSAYFRMAPTDGDGNPVAGRPVRVPVRFQRAAAALAAPAGTQDEPRPQPPTVMATPAPAPPSPAPPSYVVVGQLYPGGKLVILKAAPGTPRPMPAAQPLAPPPRSLDGIKLPTGPLGTVGVNAGHAAFFVELDDQVRRGQSVDLTFLLIMAQPPTYYGKVLVFSVTRLRMDCAARTTLDMGGKEYDEAGAMGLWLPADAASKPIKPASAYDGLAKIVCEGGKPTYTAMGATEALSMARRAVGFTPITP